MVRLLYFKEELGLPKPIYLGMDFEVENPKDVLYKNSIKQEIKQLEKEELLNELGDCLSASQILYSTNEDLKRIRYFLYKNKTQDETIEYILKLIKKHSKNVGETPNGYRKRHMEKKK